MNKETNPDPEYEAALEQALGDEPDADELSQMKAVLQKRRAGLREDFNLADNDKEREKLRRDLKKLDEQIAVLAEETEITRFVEDAVKVGLEMRRWESS